MATLPLDAAPKADGTRARACRHPRKSLPPIGPPRAWARRLALAGLVATALPLAAALASGPDFQTIPNPLPGRNSLNSVVQLDTGPFGKGAGVGSGSVIDKVFDKRTKTG